MSEPIASMTGYARSTASAEGEGIACEIKSVNSRGLDVRLRLAPGMDALESELRRRVGRVLARGSITLTVDVERDAAGTDIVVNEQALASVLTAIDALSERIVGQAPRLEGILALKGVLVERQPARIADEEDLLYAAILATVEKCLAGLVEARRSEGDHLKAIITARLDEIAALTRAAENHPSRSREAVLERLRAQLADLREAGAGLSEERLAQEAVLLATKADIREELDRLATHVAAARQLLAYGGPIGRKLDFLSQEFNREANTLCSKSATVELTAIGLDLKAAIDQLREQVQNIE
ncbi:MAG TPA: YicC/YloC family endoribonuclease [Devosiaceae bacterium]|nr:YicC/YloC family endoribonuclease [Devosiaceae bacterium]